MDATPYRPECLEDGVRFRRSGLRGFSQCLGLRRGRLPGVLVYSLLCALLPLAGCGHSDHPPLGRVHGKVTLNGSPLPSALVIFHPPKGHISCNITDGEGHYDLIFIRQEHGAIVGKHRVEITTQASEELRKELVPAKYNKKSVLEKEVVAGENEINFDLQ